MLCAVITDDNLKKIEEANQLADLIELRIDLFKNPKLKKIQKLRQACRVPVIFKGGEQFLSCQPDYVDLPYESDPALFEKCRGIKRICSFHECEKSPENLDFIFNRPAEIYKVATMARSSIDVLKMLLFVKEQKKPVIGICMGELGAATRILAPVVGSPFTYAPIDKSEQCAPGQLSLQELAETYRYRELDKETELFALIGNPVHKSPSHLVHNIAFGEFGLNAVYVKMQVTPEELPAFLPLARKVGFRGFSVTMPLKERVIPLLNKIYDDVGAINTLLFKRKKIHGWNTDGRGALDAIERVENVRGKRMVLLGAGGVAKGIGSEAKKRGAQLIILNRNLSRARDLAEELGGESANLADFPAVAEQGYDMVVNCTPILPIDPDDLLENRLVMDVISNPRETPLLLAAKEKGCRTVSGYKMFILQAVEQYEHWFNLHG